MDFHTYWQSIFPLFMLPPFSLEVLNLYSCKKRHIRGGNTSPWIQLNFSGTQLCGQLYQKFRVFSTTHRWSGNKTHYGIWKQQNRPFYRQGSETELELRDKFKGKQGLSRGRSPDLQGYVWALSKRISYLLELKGCVKVNTSLCSFNKLTSWEGLLGVVLQYSVEQML